MTYGGRVKGGVVVLEGSVDLPEGTPVRVEIVEPAMPSTQPATATGTGPSLLDLAGTIDDLPADFSRNHDHYIHGTAKRNP